MYVCMYVCMCVVCMYVCVYECMSVCMFVRNYVRNYVCMYVCMYVCVASNARSSMLPFLRLVFIVVRFTSKPFSISYAKNHAMIRRPDPPPPSTNAIFENNCTTPVIHKPIIPNLNLQILVNIKLR